MLISVSGNLLKFPRQCACCCKPADTFYETAASRTTGKRVIRTNTQSWEVPYCSSCVAHARQSPSSWGCLTMLLILLTSGLWIIAQVLLDAAAKTKTKKMLSPTCACPGWAVDFRGWQGTVKTFNFISATYLAEFALANSRSLVNVRPELLQLLERYEQNQRAALATARAKPSPAPSPREAAPDEASVVISVLADIEAARGPASRRAALDRGLRRVTRTDLRDELLTRAAQLETRAVLDKVDSLKSKAAKRRHLEEGLLSLKTDAVSDDLQDREIKVLEEALRELDG